MEIMAILLLVSVLIVSLFYYSNKLSRKECVNTTDNHFKPLLDELKNIDRMQFQTVSGEIIYSKSLSVLLKTVGYLLSFAAAAFLLDFITIMHFKMNDPGDVFFSLLLYLISSFVVFIFSLLSCTWDYTYFKYGLSNQLKHADIAFTYINTLPRKILKHYPSVFIISYFLGIVALGTGFIGVLVGTVLYELCVTIYFALEVKRIGFAPIFNLITEKLDQLKGKKNAKSTQ